MERRKGLRSLIPTGTLEEEPERPVMEVSTARVKPNPRQPRQQTAEEGLRELMESIKTHGILQPLVVRPLGKDYELIAGERRLRAAQELKLATVPVVLKDVGDREALEMALVENLQREDINPMDAATSYARLMDEFSMTQEEVAARVGKSRSAVANTLRLTGLPEEVQGAVRRGQIEEGHGKVLAGVADPTLAGEICRRVVRRGMSVQETDRLVRRVLRRNVPRGTILGGPNISRPLDPNLAAVQDKLMEQFSARVTIRARARKPGGTIEIEYADIKHLDSILTQIIK